MAMTKAELQKAYDKYHARMARARRAVREGLHRQAVQEALEAWPAINGMMQYGKRYAGETFESIAAIDLVLKYVPLLLDFRQLDRLNELLKACRRIEQQTETQISEQVEEARSKMRMAHCLWDHIERNPGVLQSELRLTLGGHQQDWVNIATTWEQMGLLGRTPKGGTYELAFRTRMGQMTSAKCPECGEVTQAPKAMLLDELACPACGRRVVFVLVPPSEAEG